MVIKISRYRLDMGSKPIKSVSQIGINAVPADATASGLVLTLTLSDGVAMSYGDVGYIASTGKVSFVDATSIVTCSAIVMCVDSSIATAGTGTFMLHGIARNDSWNWTTGLIYVSTTATTGNTLTQTAPTATNSVTQVIGIAIAATELYFNPQLVQIEHT